MSAALHLAGLDDGPKLLPMIAAFHAEFGLDISDIQREEALTPVLEGSPYAAAYIIGPRRSPVGYITVSFGWSMELGGLDGFVDEFFIRPSVRRRGMGTEVLLQLLPALGSAGVKALHMEVQKEDDSAKRLFHKAGFRARDGYVLMSRTF